MRTLEYCGLEYTYYYAVRGADFVHLYDEDDRLIVAFDNVTDFDDFNIPESEYRAAEDCLLEKCNNVKHVGGRLVREDGDPIGRLDAYSQGRSAMYNITTKGWKRILVFSRNSCGSLNLSVGKANSSNGYAWQNLGLEITSNVNFPGTSDKPLSFDTVPVIYQRFCHEMGENNGADESRKGRISKVRIGHPKKTAGKTSPVMCVVDVYVDEVVKGSVAFCMNYVGYADAYNCEAITEETNATDTIVDKTNSGDITYELKYVEYTPNTGVDLCVPKAKIGNMPYEYVRSTADNTVILRNLESGLYYIEGSIKYYPSGGLVATSSGLFVVTKASKKSHVVRLAPDGPTIRYYTITDTSSTSVGLDHASVVELEEKVAALEQRVANLETS